MARLAAAVVSAATGAQAVRAGQIVSDIAVAKFKSALADMSSNGLVGDAGIAAALNEALIQFVTDSTPEDGNTYAAPRGEVPGMYARRGDSLGREVVGANGRRLVAHLDDRGVYLGACLISDPVDARRFADWLRECADSARDRGWAK